MFGTSPGDLGRWGDVELQITIFIDETHYDAVDFGVPY